MTERDRHPMYRFHGRHVPKQDGRTPILNKTPSTEVTAEGVATLRLYDPIDDWGEFWGVSAKEFAEALDQVRDAKEIRLLVNSPGGMVYEGIAILNLLRNHPAKVVAVVEGIAASAASFIVAGADEVVMNPNSELMIHDAWGICMGPAEDMRDLADRLDQLSNNIASVYVARAGGTVESWRAAMLAETWYSADEAVAVGLADRVESGSDAADDKAKNRFDLAGLFNYSGRSSAPPPPTARTTPVAAVPNPVGAPPTPTGDTPATMNTEDEQRLARLLSATPYDATNREMTA